MTFQFADTSEKGFQKLIVNYLKVEHYYRESVSSDFDREFCLNTKQLFEFIESTQPDTFDMIKKKGERAFLVRLDEKIHELGIIEVLRKGIKHLDKTIDLFYRKPSSKFNNRDLVRYSSNIFSVTEELKYSLDNENRLDVTIFLNGIPILTMELKNSLTGQTVQNGIRQYKNDRDSKEKLFSFGRCMVHFAADTESVFMCSHLKDKNSDFLPFNKGLNDGNPLPPFGAGNPVNKDGLRTHYLWEQILSKDSLSNIIDKFAQIFEEKDEDTGRVTRKMIFPRYHQLTVVRAILQHAKEKGIGQRYLVQHSAGSGKSNSIAWLAHQLINLYDSTGENHIFDSTIVVTDRIVLDKQLRETIKQFSQTKGIVEAITGEGGSKTNQLREAIANKKKVIITTIQTFPHLLDEMQELPSLKFGIIIDEAHSSQSGETAAKMNAVLSNKQTEDEESEDPEEPTLEDKINELIDSRKMIKNGSYFAFTATPKNKTLETFGVPVPVGDKVKHYPFHLYSMKQAIDEEFIIDVLQNYTTYNSFYKLIKSTEANPDYNTKEAQKKLRAYVEGHEFAISEKAKIMLDHFHKDVRYLINGEAKAMVVTKGIIAAIKYKHAFNEYLKEIKSPFKAIIAFSGKKTYKGIEYDEVSMNSFESYKNDIPKNFKKSQYKFLIVANKYQTGFDQPLLHTMYVDKKLRDVQAVQTLSRLNRSYKPYKRDTFVLDFYNSTDDIKEAFEPYYTATILSEETNPNKLNDLQDALDAYEVYSEEQVHDFFKKYISKAERTIIDPIIDSSVHIFDNDLNLDKKIDFKIKVKSFLRTYSYLAKLLDFNNKYWEQLWWFLKLLVAKLKIPNDDNLTEGLLESVDMESYRPIKEGTNEIKLADDKGTIDPIPVKLGGGAKDSEFDTLENIIKTFNQRFGDIDWSDKDKVHKILTEQLPAEMQADTEIINAIKYSDRQNAKITSDNKIKDLIGQYLFTQTEIYKKFTQDADFQRRYKEFVFDALWQKNR
jgi:type I restriction enzyme R subunit